MMKESRFERASFLKTPGHTLDRIKASLGTTGDDFDAEPEQTCADDVIVEGKGLVALED